MSDVPPSEIFSDIFSRLPVKPLLRLRCVSEKFCALIDSPDFIKSHLNHSLKSNNNQTILFTKNGDLHSIAFDSLDHNNNADLLHNYNGAKVLGCCNGMVLCLSRDEDMFLLNPSTREHKKVPFSEVQFPEDLYYVSIHSVVYGLGYDHLNDDYKVVRVIQFEDEEEEEVMEKKEFKVYSLKSNTWRRIKEFPYLFYSTDDNGVLVNGALHWIVLQKPNGRGPWCEKIVSFNIATEEYDLIMMPKYTPSKDGYTLRYDPHTEECVDTISHKMDMEVGELGGRLCVQCIYNLRYIDIWVMNSYGEVDSWTKLCSVKQPVDAFRSEYKKAIAYSNDGEKLLLEQEGGRLVWYDLKLETVEDIKIPGSPYVFDPYLCIESLVRLTSGAEQVKREKGKRKAMPSRDDFPTKGCKLKL